MAHEFKEKAFLLILLEDYENKNGQNISYLNAHMFSNIPLRSNGTHKRFSLGTNQHAFYKREAQTRGFIQITDGGIQYHFTELGYSKALEYKRPVKTFIKKHWKYMITTTIALVSLVISLLSILISLKG